jgi:UDP-N-acetylmuramate dehydrogenase
MSWLDRLPEVRGRLLRDEPLGPFTWFRVGGPADLLFLPQDEDDLAAFLMGLDPAVPVTLLGVGSNTLVRDGGVEGVVIRLGKAFAAVEPRGGNSVFAGAAALDATLAREAGKAGIAGLEFYRGVPGSVGGALVMNAGCYGSETKDVLVEAYALTRAGTRLTLSNADLGYSYRKSARAAAEPLIFLGGLFEGRPDDPAAIAQRMDEITARREQTQPIREKTGGSTFKNPPGHSSGEATAADLEGLGETVRAEVKAKLGVDLDWEIKRIGRP